MSQEVTETQTTESALKEFREAGVPIEKAQRPYLSKRMTGFNAEVYAGWIERWANNAAINYPIVNRSEGVGLLRNCAKDVPAIIVGIGPSLDDEILNLKNANHHAIIIATDAALRPLIRHGITPDLVINYDARDHQKNMFDSVDTSGLVLLANTVTSPLTVEAWKGKVMFFNMMQSDDEFASNILPALFPFTGQLPNIGTVGNGAVFLAWQMGCKPIITVGMDLCYRESRYRCKDWEPFEPTAEFTLGGWREKEDKSLYDNEARLKETFDVEIKGKTYKIDECLKHYRTSLVEAIGKFDIPLIDCSGGVLTDLVRSMPLKKVLEEKCYASIDQGRTIMKHLFKLIPDGKDGWEFMSQYNNDREEFFFNKR